MKSNTVRSAVELIDAEPSAEFLSALRARLLSDYTATEVSPAQRPSASAAETVEEYIVITPSLQRTGPNRRMQKVLMAAAACVVVLGGIFVISRLKDDPGAESAPLDVDAGEALPLAEAAKITPDALGSGWKEKDYFKGSTYADMAAAMTAAKPACAQLNDVGLAQPTTKSVIFHQYFLNGSVPMLHDVWVFATKADASRAMDVIAGDVYPTCLFDFFDRTTALSPAYKATSISQSFAVPPPAIKVHGDRQVIIGQQIDYSLSAGQTATAVAVNAYVQVGRAIAFIDAEYLGDTGPDSNVEHTITVSTDALEKVFGH